MMNQIDQKSVTAIVNDQVKKSYLKEYEEWLKSVHERLATFQGFLGLEVSLPKFPLDKEYLDYHIIFRFDQFDNLLKWEQSDFLKDRLELVSEFIHSKTNVQYLQGMELWYNMSKEKAKNQRPLFWKQVLVTIFTVYPLILGADLFLNLFFPMHLLKPQIAIFFTVLIVATLMVYPVMPFVTKHIGSWLHKK